MDRTVADTIRELTRAHIANNRGIVMGQCLTAVGWVQNTIPEQLEGIVELPMTDVSGAGFAVGAAVMGRRPVFVIRFQSFLWLNASPIVNYAAKSKEVFGYPCPVFVRAIAAEGNGTGPLHTNCFHAIFMHMPGLPVCAPMTPGEYESIWDHYITHDDPMFVSEHRRSYKNTAEMPNQYGEDSQITIFAISASRFNAVEAVKKLAEQGIKADLSHVVWLKPFDPEPQAIEALKRSGRGMVIDSAYELAGASQALAYELMLRTGKPVKAVGQFDRSPGASPRLDNGTPTVDRIVATAKEMIAH